MSTLLPNWQFYMRESPDSLITCTSSSKKICESMRLKGVSLKIVQKYKRAMEHVVVSRNKKVRSSFFFVEVTI